MQKNIAQIRVHKRRPILVSRSSNAYLITRAANSIDFYSSSSSSSVYFSKYDFKFEFSSLIFSSWSWQKYEVYFST